MSRKHVDLVFVKQCGSRWLKLFWCARCWIPVGTGKPRIPIILMIFTNFIANVIIGTILCIMVASHLGLR